MTRGKFTCVQDAEGNFRIMPVESETRRPLEAPAIQTDEIPDGIQSMVNGQWFYSRSRYRQHLKETGHIEIGNEEIKPGPHWSEDPIYQRQLKEDAARAYYEARDGMAPIDELTRERCRQMDRNLEHYNYDRRELDEYGRPRE